MKNSKLLFISILIIAVLAGTAHLFAGIESTGDTETPVFVPSPAIQEEEEQVQRQPETQQQKTNWELLEGKWEVMYKSDDFTGSIVYRISKDKNSMNAYTVKYIDENGDSLNSEKLVLIVKSFSGKSGKGTYKLEYEGKAYDIPCKVKMTDPNHFELSYSYYDYSDKETWTRITE
ncbi:hypothetical protein GWK08_00175 [Leptobacterium flavescens]|uniref:Uncharacterized protein n=1 Tax=Leptobacterium flavescens TaxID=472055 RepID=A0A6P0UF27_9FLAO|nr:hypothetical protein [Leptobacterium flavescens]NER11845.1 hypothetical protein [Leptobacterium flavescens]